MTLGKAPGYPPAHGELVIRHEQDAVLSMVDEVSEVIVHVEPDVPIPFPRTGVLEEGSSDISARS